jgi:2-oxoglutarate dehydrogenase E1 component
LDLEKLKQIIQQHPVEEYLFVQDEPKNMGAYNHLGPQITPLLNGVILRYVGRAPSSSPAAGSPKTSIQEWNQIMKEIFDGQ